MSVFPKGPLIKEVAAKPGHKWSIKDGLKNAVHAYKAYKNSGMSEEVFRRTVLKEVVHYLEDKIISLPTKVLIKNSDLLDSGFSAAEYLISLQSITEILENIVHIEVSYDKKDGINSVIIVELTLIKS